MIPVVEALSIIYIAPVLTMCLAAIILGTIQKTLFPFYHNQLFSGLVLVIGELLICQPGFLFPSETSPSQDDSSYYLLGVSLAFIACLSGSLDAIFVNMLKTEVNV